MNRTNMMTAASFTMLVATVYAFQGPMVLSVIGNPFAVRAHALPESPQEWVRIPEGTRFLVRLESRLSTPLSSVGDTFQARLLQPVQVDGLEVAPAGAPVFGHVTARDGHGQAGSRLHLQLDAVEIGPARVPLGATGEPYESATRLVSNETGPGAATIVPVDGNSVAQGPIVSFTGGTRVEFRLGRGIRVRVPRS